MEATLGQIGLIKHIYSDKDLKIEVCGNTWTYNPSCVESKQKINNSSNNLNEELIDAASNGDIIRTQNILNSSCCVDVNFLVTGHTALHAAAHNGNLAIIRMLFENKADIEIEDKDGDRAIHHAAFGNESDVIDLLESLTTKLDLNSMNKKKQTALHIAVNKQHLNVISTLIRLGCHVSLQDINGDTPLHGAILRKNDSIVDLLIKSNADLTVCNKNSFNALQLATLRGNIK